MADIPQHQIRALYDASTIRVYQAYGDAIADNALTQQTFVSPFKFDRMTWIKPSFLWMMYRAGWGYKDDGQRRILAIDMIRAGFEWALTHSCPSHPSPSMRNEEWTALKDRSPVRIQWDPERDIRLQPLPYRSIQIGLGNEASRRYVSEWIQKITDVTELAHSIHALLGEEQVAQAEALLPAETIYPFADV